MLRHWNIIKWEGIDNIHFLNFFFFLFPIIVLIMTKLLLDYDNKHDIKLNIKKKKKINK